MEHLNFILLSASSSGGEVFFLFLINILLSVGIGKLGSKRKIGFGWAFVLSLVLGVLIGLIVVLCSKKKDTEFIDMNE